MLISELIEQLQDKLKWDGDAEVRVAYQPSYPLRAEISNVTFVEPDADDDDEPQEKILWLAVDGVYSSESPYAPRRAWED